MIESGGPPPDACGAYMFGDDADEANWLADEIDALLQTGVSPRDICVLTRKLVPLYTAALSKALQLRAIVARVEEPYQDLLSEPVVSLLLLAFRALLTATPGVSWALFRSELATLQGLEDDVDLATLDHSLAALRCQLQRLAPTVPLKANQIRSIIADSIEPRFLAALRNRYAQYQRGSFYEQNVNNICTSLAKVGAGGTWEKAITEIEGANSIPMMTIHKSKGLEYAAVFFIGLEDGAFFGFSKSRPEQVEELNTFFVAISRAKQRVAFTFAQRRVLGDEAKQSSRKKMRELYQLLEDADVPVTTMDSA
jgi:superfamily I DNA/RNA helicase